MIVVEGGDSSGISVSKLDPAVRKKAFLYKQSINYDISRGKKNGFLSSFHVEEWIRQSFPRKYLLIRHECFSQEKGLSNKFLIKICEKISRFSELI